MENHPKQQIKQSLTIMQWNARSAVANHNSLNQFIREHGVDIALLSETWYKPHFKIRFTGYHMVRKDRMDGKAGVAILIKNSLEYKSLSIKANYNDDILVCGAQILYKSNIISLLSIYRPPKVNATREDWENIYNQSPSPSIICGDYNAHHGVWGSPSNDQTGTQIEGGLNSTYGNSSYYNVEIVTPGVGDLLKEDVVC